VTWRPDGVVAWSKPPRSGVDQPGLALGELEDAVHRVLGELLAGRLGVLVVELGDLVSGEVAQAQ